MLLVAVLLHVMLDVNSFSRAHQLSPKYYISYLPSTTNATQRLSDTSEVAIHALGTSSSVDNKLLSNSFV